MFQLPFLDQGLCSFTLHMHYFNYHRHCHSPSLMYYVHYILYIHIYIHIKITLDDFSLSCSFQTKKYKIWYYKNIMGQNNVKLFSKTQTHTHTQTHTQTYTYIALHFILIFFTNKLTELKIYSSPAGTSTSVA